MSNSIKTIQDKVAFKTALHNHLSQLFGMGGGGGGASPPNVLTEKKNHVHVLTYMRE